MKVLLVNGSPHAHGCTYTALCEIASVLHSEGIETEIFQLGTDPIRGCAACHGCSQSKRCVFDDDPVNRALEIAKDCDGFIFGSPVHYASAGGSITSFMDRMFYAGSSVMRGKPAAAIVSARRAGTTAAIDQLNKYFTISGMPIASSQYWNSVHGYTPDDVRKDKEGLQVMRALGRNMAFLIKSIALGKEQFGLPEKEKRVATNFID